MSNNQGCIWWARNESERFETMDATQISLIVLKMDTCFFTAFTPVCCFKWLTSHIMLTQLEVSLLEDAGIHNSSTCVLKCSLLFLSVSTEL